MRLRRWRARTNWTTDYLGRPGKYAFKGYTYDFGYFLFKWRAERFASRFNMTAQNCFVEVIRVTDKRNEGRNAF